jgi:hypothetical protein
MIGKRLAYRARSTSFLVCPYEAFPLASYIPIYENISQGVGRVRVEHQYVYPIKKHRSVGLFPNYSG